jgi:hypothetical protein
MDCQRDLVDGSNCREPEAEDKFKPLGHRPGWAGPRIHHECVKGHVWHENYGNDIGFITDCDCPK